MISFQPTEEQLATRQVLESIARDVLRPTARANDRDGCISDAALSALDATGLIEAALSGDDEARPSCVSGAIALEALAHADASLAVAVAAPLGFARAVMARGSDAQRDRLLRAWSQPGFKSAAVLIQEPGFYFDVTKPKTTARLVGPGVVLSGVKSCVPRASACSDFLVVAQGEEGLSAYLVAPDAAGITTHEPEGTLGLKSVAFVDVTFNDVSLPADARLDVDVQVLIDSARTAAAAIMTGVSSAVLDYLTPYLKQRVAHGSALAQKQSVAFRLADMAVDIPSMRWMTWRAAAALDKGGGATREARLAHAYCAEQALWITDEGVQLMGGHGYMRDNPVERWYRDVRMLSLIEGMVGL